MHVSTSHQEYFPSPSSEIVQVARSASRWHCTSLHYCSVLACPSSPNIGQLLSPSPVVFVVCRSYPSPFSSWRSQRASPACSSTIEISPKRASSAVRMRLRRDGALVRDSRLHSLPSISIRRVLCPSPLTQTRACAPLALAARLLARATTRAVPPPWTVAAAACSSPRLNTPPPTAARSVTLN